MTTVLVVDDDSDFVDLCIEALETRGFTAEGETNSPKVRKHLRNKHYDVILLDIAMPGYEGAEVLKDIMSHSLSNRVIAVSGAVDEVEEILKCIRLGAIDFLSKPLKSIPELIDRIKVVLERPTLIVNQHIVRENLIQSLWFDVKHGNRSIKGRRLEQLLKLVFESIGGFNVKMDVHTKFEQIDIEIVNERSDPFWAQRGSIILAECKNWSPTKTIQRGYFDEFSGKLRRRPKEICKLAFFISYSGFSQGFQQALMVNKTGQQLIVPIDRNGIQQLVQCQKREDLLKEFVVKATH